MKFLKKCKIIHKVCGLSKSYVTVSGLIRLIKKLHRSLKVISLEKYQKAQYLVKYFEFLALKEFEWDLDSQFTWKLFVVQKSLASLIIDKKGTYSQFMKFSSTIKRHLKRLTQLQSLTIRIKSSKVLDPLMEMLNMLQSSKEINFQLVIDFQSLKELTPESNLYKGLCRLSVDCIDMQNITQEQKQNFNSLITKPQNLNQLILRFLGRLSLMDWSPWGALKKIKSLKKLEIIVAQTETQSTEELKEFLEEMFFPSNIEIYLTIQWNQHAMIPQDELLESRTLKFTSIKHFSFHMLHSLRTDSKEVLYFCLSNLRSLKSLEISLIIPDEVRPPCDVSSIFNNLFHLSASLEKFSLTYKETVYRKAKIKSAALPLWKRILGIGSNKFSLNLIELNLNTALIDIKDNLLDCISKDTLRKLHISRIVIGINDIFDKLNHP